MSAQEEPDHLPVINAWSYSRLKDYETCPAFAMYAHSKGTPYKNLRVFGPAAARGSAIHGRGERYLKGKLKDLPEAYNYVKQPMKKLRKVGAASEVKWTFTDSWTPTEWTAPDAWLRLAIDARVEDGAKQRVIDFKTGKVYDDHPQQLELYALATFKLFPKTEVVTVEAWYLDIGEIHDVDIKREEEEELTTKWEARAQVMLDATEFPANPCWKCRFCDFAASKGGPCQEEKK